MKVLMVLCLALTLGSCRLVTAPFEITTVHKLQQPQRVAGTIVSEKGEPIDHATVKIMYDWYDWNIAEGTFSDYPEQSRTIGATFSETVPGQVRSVIFSAPGYYSKSYFVTTWGKVALHAEGSHESDESRRVEMTVGDMQIKLRRHGPVAALTQRVDLIWIDKEGGGVIMAPSRESRDWDGVRYVESVAKTPAGFLYVNCARDGGGIVTVVGKEDDCGCRTHAPAEVRLGISGQGNGLILCSPKNEKDVWWEMREAPAERYRNEIVLDAGEVQRLTEWKPVWFFIKCNGQYGRGQVVRKDGEKAGDVITRYELEADFKMQRDGSRNLEEE